MGLDMYLSAEKFVSGYDHSNDENFQKILDLLNLEKNDVQKSITVKVTVGYWRKANAVHNWFVQKIQKGKDDCGEYYVSNVQLRELREDCAEALAAYRDGDLSDADSILPTKSGFFFGSTAIDEYYASDLKETISIIDRCLSDKFQNFDFIYRSSW